MDTYTITVEFEVSASSRESAERAVLRAIEPGVNASTSVDSCELLTDDVSLVRHYACDGRGCGRCEERGHPGLWPLDDDDAQVTT